MTNRHIMVATSVIVAVAIAASAYALNSIPFTAQDESIFPEPVFVEGYSLTVLTDKLEYNLGEQVRYTIINTGTENAWFNRVTYTSLAEVPSRNTIFSIPESSVLLQPGEQKSGIWEQVNRLRLLVHPGTYVIEAGEGRSDIDDGKSEPFTIVYDESAYPKLIFVDRLYLAVITDKREYKIGEPIRYTVINTGTGTVYSDITPQINIKNHSGKVVFEKSIPEQYSLTPRSVSSFIWNQDMLVGDSDEFNGQQISAGTYVIVAYGWESEPFVIRE